MNEVGEKVEVKQESLNIERLALTAVIAMLGWNVYTTNQLTIQNAVTQSKLEGISSRLESQNNQFVSRADFVLLESYVEQQSDRYEVWLNRLSDRVNALEVERTEEDRRQ